MSQAPGVIPQSSSASSLLVIYFAVVAPLPEFVHKSPVLVWVARTCSSAAASERFKSVDGWSLTAAESLAALMIYSFF